MVFDQCCTYAAAKPAASLHYPFTPDVAVYKVGGKIFALVSPKGQQNPAKSPQMNLKCDPYHAQELRDIFESIIPGYHMNKRHWNTLILDNTLPVSEIQRLMDHSYAIVVKSLSPAIRTPLELKYSPDVLYQELKPY
jgi:predicted DNA-binding protein (MmcQ/YjbR family)